jgi:hypothetical protein
MYRLLILHSLFQLQRLQILQRRRLLWRLRPAKIDPITQIDPAIPTTHSTIPHPG